MRTEISYRYHMCQLVAYRSHSSLRDSSCCEGGQEPKARRTLVPGLSFTHSFRPEGSSQGGPAWEPDLASLTRFMVWLVVVSTQLHGSAARVGEQVHPHAPAGCWLLLGILWVGLVEPVSATDIWWDTVLPFLSGGSVAVLGNYFRDMVLGPSCFSLSRQEAQQLVKGAAQHCCHELEGATASTTSTTMLPRDPWDFFWAGLGWAKLGFFIGFLACLLVVGFAGIFLRGRFGSNDTAVPAISAAPLPLVYHVDAEAESKAALASQQIQITRQRFGKVLE